ncbi:MAG: hypothetical protein U0441_06530 [Polyangiaceae bacterium]
MRHRITTATLPALFCTALLAAAGCGSPPPPEAPKPPEKPKLRATLKLPPRVVPASAGRVEHVGSAAGKNLYTVGDERWLIDSAGVVSRAPDVLGERLSGVISSLQPDVPAIGWNTNRAFAFTDLLAEPKYVVESEATLTRVRPGPGSMFVLGLWSAAAFDVEHGVERQGFFPSLPIRDAVFADAHRGAVAAAVGGIATTSDGGRTWKPLVFKPAGTLPLSLDVVGGDLYVRDSYSVGRAAKIDLGTNRLGDFAYTGTVSAPGATDVEKWITARGNPIPAAVRNGIDAGNGMGIVAHDGIAFQVDLATGLFRDHAGFESSKMDCSGTMAGKEAYLLCGKKPKGRELGERLFHVVTAPALRIEDIAGAEFGGNGYADLVGSPAGGLLVGQGCGSETGNLCVRKPDGTWLSVPGDDVPYRGTAAPLVDGRVLTVGIRGTVTGPVLELLAVDDKKKTVLAESVFDDRMMVNPSAPEEGEDKAVRFVVTEQVKDKKAVYFYLYAFEPGKKGFRKTAIEGVAGAHFRDGELVVHEESDKGSRFRVSHDLGATYADLDMPPQASPEVTSVTRLGIVSPKFTRVGWEPLPASPPPRAKIKADFRLPATPPPPKSESTLACKTSGGVKSGHELPKYGGDLIALYGLKPPPVGSSRTWIQFAASPMDVSLLLAVEGPSKAPAKGAQTWIARWLDPREPDAKVRSVTAKVPFGFEGARIRGVWSEEGRLFFTIAFDREDRNILFRTKGGGLEWVEIKSGLAPWSSSSVAYSADGNTLAYLTGDVLVTWKSGEAPRAIGAVLSRFGTLLGTPGKEGVPVIADVEGNTYYRVFPIPEGKPKGTSDEEWVHGSWEGWSRVPSLFGNKGVVMPCDAKPAGVPFRSNLYGPDMWLRFRLDADVLVSGKSMRYEVVSDGHDLCLQSVLYQPSSFVKLQVKKGATSAEETFDMIRYWAKGQKGEITRSGHDAKIPLVAMKCEGDKPSAPHKQAP